MKERQCRSCGEWKPLATKFHKASARGEMRWCKDCRAEYSCLLNAIGSEAAKKFIKENQARWDYKPKFPPPDRLITEVEIA